MTPFYQDAAVTLYCAEYRDVIDSIGPVDAIITDPPYGETSLDWDVWPARWPSHVLHFAPQLWCFGSMRMFFDHSSEFSDWKLAQDIVWEKHNGSGFADDRFKRVHELALHFYRGAWGDLYHNPPRVRGTPQRYIRHESPAHTGRIGGHTHSELRTERIQRSVIPVRSCHGHAVNETQKPEGIIAPLMEYSVGPGGIVLDLFAGSGTSLAVARSQGKRAIGIEKRESQCQAIVARLAQGDLFAAG